MSVKDVNKQMIISSCLTGEILSVIPYDLYKKDTIQKIIDDIAEIYLFGNEHGIMIKFGFKT